MCIDMDCMSRPAVGSPIEINDSNGERHTHNSLMKVGMTSTLVKMQRRTEVCVRCSLSTWVSNYATLVGRTSPTFEL